MKKILIAVGILSCFIYSSAMAANVYKFTQYSSSGNNNPMTCVVVSIQENTGTGTYTNPANITSFNMRGVTQKYSSVYYTPTAKENFIKVTCYPTATGPVDSSIPRAKYTIDSNTNAVPFVSELLKCH